MPAAAPLVPPQPRQIEALNQDLAKVKNLANPRNRALRAHRLSVEADASADSRLDERNESLAILYWRDGWPTSMLARFASVDTPLLQKIRNAHRPKSAADPWIEQLAADHPNPADEALAAGRWIAERRALAKDARAVRNAAVLALVGSTEGRGTIAALARDLGLSAARISQIIASSPEADTDAA